MGCMNLVKEWEILKTGEGSRKRLGEFGERVAAVLFEQILGHVITGEEATRGRPQGIDFTTLSPADRITIMEAKATRLGDKSKPSLSKKQMTVEWIAALQHGGKPSRAAEMGLDQVDADDVQEGYVERLVVLVNVTEDQDTVSVWEVGADGKVGEATLTIGLEDLVRFSQALNDDE